jgi:biotin carboxyl carrier protein
MVARHFRIKVNGTWHTVEIADPEKKPLSVVVDGEQIEVEIEATSLHPDTKGIKKKQSTNTTADIPTGLQGIIESNSKLVRSPMPGRIVSISLNVSDKLSVGSEICILETMKMEQSIQISREGTIRVVFVATGENVKAGDPIIQLD